MQLPPWEQVQIFLSTHQVLLGWLVLLSFITFIGTLLVVPVLVVRLPRDYLSAGQRVDPADYGLWWWPLQALKNILGLVLVAAGLAMLVLPGQGLLTLFIGLSLVNFPGKSKVLHGLVRRPRIMGVINWLRKKRNVPPLEIPENY